MNDQGVVAVGPKERFVLAIKEADFTVWREDADQHAVGGEQRGQHSAVDFGVGRRGGVISPINAISSKMQGAQACGHAPSEMNWHGWR